ncbi:hypothetical protein C8R44DRAFT_37333 [Mycena epipterygia]|nr:hypothetical protein C8R44DRAFT_37333 [Mycena epipterygia]
MIITEEKTGSSTLPSPSLAVPSPPGYYINGSYAGSSSNTYSSRGSSSGMSDGLRPPPRSRSASETALSLPPPTFLPLSATVSHTYLPVAPAQPPSLSRAPPPNLPKTPFPPMFLLAQGNSLRQGFPCIMPPTTHQPHPFALYDVNETDWTQFLEEMRTVASLSPQDKVTANCVPILSAVPIINVAVAAAITHHIRRKKPRLVSFVVDKWNHHFFHPRRIEVILMRGENKLSGQSDQPVANLYTPRTVNFTPPPLDSDPKRGEKHGSHNDSDKTYRLFVVSMES